MVATASASNMHNLRPAGPFTIRDLNRDVTFDGPFLSVAGLLAVALLAGGGGSRFPISEMLVQLAALPALYFAFFGAAGRSRSGGHGFPALLLGLCVLLVLVQLVPLPPSIWQSLPGREVLTEIAEAAGLVSKWYPISIEPELTFRAGLSLVVPAGILLAGMRLTQKERMWLLGLVIVLTGVNFAVAGLQLASGGSAFYPYSTSHKGLPLGLFANRNHFALLLLLTLVAAVALLNFYRTERKPAPSGAKRKVVIEARVLAVATGAILVAAMVMATGSRTVSVLFVLSVLPLALLSLPATKWTRALFWLALMGLGLGGVLYAMVASGRFEVANRLMDRFALETDERFEFWPDALDALWANFPFGTGMGTFDTAFRMYEKLDKVGQRFVNNAHNDYIEVGIEAGAVGLAIFAALLMWCAVRAITLGRSGAREGDIRAGWCAAFALLLVSLHSLTDYPVRRLAIMALCALLLSVLAAAGREKAVKTTNPTDN